MSKHKQQTICYFTHCDQIMTFVFISLDSGAQFNYDNSNHERILRGFLIIQQVSTMKIGCYTYQKSKQIGSGTSGRVYRGVNMDTQQQLAIKVISKDLIDPFAYMRSALATEVNILRSLVSEHTVALYDVRESTNNYYIIMELCDSDLGKIIKQGKQLPEEDCIIILTQICQGFLALVKEGIIHRDLKPENIMRKGKVFKIGDFGFSKQFQQQRVNTQSVKDKNMMKSEVGTYQYMSIQQLKRTQYSNKCDIWALGLIFYQMLHGEMPWVAQTNYDLIKKMETINLTIKRKDLSAATKNFIEKCLKLQECDRINWNQLFQHPIFKGRFLSKCDVNKQLQNKMKGIMTKLRKYFHQKPENIIHYFTSSNFLSKEKYLNFKQYFQFLKIINPTITQDEADYIFTRTDLDSSGTISLNQIIKVLEMYGMNVENLVTSGIRGLDTKIMLQKLEKFFVKLQKLMYKYKLSLRRVFTDFDKDVKKGQMTFEEFKVFLQKISKDITSEEALQAFNYIDEDHSQSIQFEELLKYYQLFNKKEQQEVKNSSL